MRVTALPTALDDDRSLVEQARHGHASAYGDLIRKYQDRVYNTCFRICGDAETARDLTQDTFLRAMESLDRFQGKSRFYTWLFRIAVNLSLSERRKGSRRSTSSLHGPDGNWEIDSQAAGLRTTTQSTNPQARALRREREAAVQAAIEQLEPEQRATIVLKDIEGCDYAQIAEILELPIGTVKSRLHRGRMALKEKLRPLMTDE